MRRWRTPSTRCPLRRKSAIAAVLPLCAALAACGAPASQVVVTTPPDTLQGDGNVNRTLLTYSDLFSSNAPSAPVDDGAFAVPANAAMPAQAFEGRLDLVNPAAGGGFEKLRDDFGLLPGGDSPWKHLADFSFEFVQSGSQLIPARQGLVLTGNAAWNYIVGPGRVWRENGDNGYMRASLPFALVDRNQNCVHNGEMMFLFNGAKTPNISAVRYQVTQETCLYFKFNSWGQVAAKYTPYAVAGAQTLKDNHAAELANRLPTKPITALASDYPRAHVNTAALVRTFQFPQDITLYGVLVNGVNYVSSCQTRYGYYAFCDNMRVPSFSTAKSAFAGLALMRLGRVYGSGVYGQLIKDYVPEYVNGGDWSTVTFANTSDMATGNFISPRYMADEYSAQEALFQRVEPYSVKIADAFSLFPHRAAPGTTWVYQTHATFILTQAMNGYLQRQAGTGADIFNMLRDDVFKPIHISQGGLTTLRTDNSATGRPIGSYGLFFIADDVAKIAKLLNNDRGAVNGNQLLDPAGLQTALYRGDPAAGLPVPDVGVSIVPGTLRYHGEFWDKNITSAELPQYRCSFWVPFMSGYGGINIVLLPNGTSYYAFSDNNEFYWYDALNELNKITPLCASPAVQQPPRRR